MKMPHKNAFAAAIAAVIFTLSASAFAYALAPNALASDKNPPSLNKRVQTITKELTLTDDQVAKVCSGLKILDTLLIGVSLYSPQYLETDYEIWT